MSALEAAATDAAFVRCGACGRRVARTPGLCPLHGTVERSAGLEIDATRVVEVELPRFPGYRTLRVIGRGGFGTVLAVEPEIGGATFAVKVAHADHPSAGLRLVHEIAVLSDVGPPHVPSVYGSGELAGGEPFVVMEHVEAPTLAERLASPDPLSLADVRVIALAVLRALEAVHARGWVHCDLKPENVFIDGERAAKIVDFGLVASTSWDDAGEAGAGTAEYMAPEQWDPRGDVDARTDVYAMGVILYEMIAGAPPFWGPRATVEQAHLGRRPPRLARLEAGASIPRELDAIVHRCLAKDPRDRFESAAALREALERATASLAAPRPPAPSASSLPGARDERRTMGMLFFEADADVVSVQKRLASLGGQLAHAADGRFVVVYGHDLGDNPARVALRAAHALLREGSCERVRLDVGHVSAQRRPDGSTRFLSPIFARPERFPDAADPPGISMTDAAREVVSDADAPPTARADFSATSPSTPPPSSEAAARDADTDPLIGRDAFVDALVDSARRAVSEPVSCVVRVIAEAGHGKSHVFRVLRRRLRRLAAYGQVIDLRAVEPALGGADATVRDLLRRTMDLPDTAPEDAGAVLREALAESGAAHAVPAVAAALGWIAEDATALGPGLRTLEAAPGALRAALMGAAGATLRRRAADAPVLLLLDDAHHADEATLGALEYAALAEARAPLWICAFGRPAFEDEHPTWGQRAGRRETHRLDALDAGSAGALCRKLLLPVEDVPSSAVDRLVERAQAVPLLLIELVRGLRREGLVRRNPRGGSYYLATDELDRLPDLPLVEWLARGEIDALPDALRAHAQLSALLGDEVSTTDAAGVLARLEERGDDADLPLDAKVATQRLVAAGLLVEHKDGRIAFRHALVREAIAQEVPEPLRERIHLAAVLHYHDAGIGPDAGCAPGPEGDRRLGQLAFHAARAGLGAMAESAYLELAERMRARHAYVPAERAYSRALEQAVPEGDAGRLAAYRGRGLMRYRNGRYHDAIADLVAARTMARAKGDAAAEIEILLDEATALDWMDEYKTSELRVGDARALLANTRSPLLEARLHLGIGRSLHRFSREEEAAVELERAAALALPLRDEGYETLVIAWMMLGFIYQGLDRLDDARRALDRGIALATTHGDDLHLAGAINNRALLWASLGDRDRMIADMERGLSLARKLGQAPLELIGQANLGECLYLMDELDAAEPHVRRALEIERQRSGETGRPVLLLLDARLRFYRGEEDAARAILARIAERQDGARDAGRTDALMVPSEEVLRDAIDLATRDADAIAWDALEERAARYSVGQERIEVLEARAIAALRKGRAHEAIARLETALAAAAHIPNAMEARVRRRLDEARRAIP